MAPPYGLRSIRIHHPLAPAFAKASQGKLEAQRHREDNVSRIFRKRSTVPGKYAKPLLKKDKEGEELYEVAPN
jgi:hypothetical protein